MLLRVLQARVLLTDPIFAEGRWTDALQLLKLSHPGVSIVVAVNTPDAKLEEALLEAGGFGVTAFPFSRLGLVGVVRGAHACAPGASSSVSGQLGKEQAKGETKQSHTETVAASVHRLRRGIFSSCAISQWLRRCLPIRQ